MNPPDPVRACQSAPTPIPLSLPSEEEIPTSAGVAPPHGDHPSGFTRLPLTFRKVGFVFQQLERTDHAAIYSQTKNGVADFEVVRIRIGKEEVCPSGTVVPAGERYPASEKWGLDGWTYTTLEDARQRFNQLNTAKS